MSLSSNTDARQQALKSHTSIALDTFPVESLFTTPEQIQRFELLRLAFFVLKLRKIQEAQALREKEGSEESQKGEETLRCNLLQHAIFQQVVALTGLGVREQAMQIISTCHKKEK